MKKQRIILSLLLALALFTQLIPAMAAEDATVISAPAEYTDTYIDALTAYYAEKGTENDWQAIGLLVNGKPVPGRVDEALALLEKNKGEFRMATDAARTALLLKAAGWDIKAVEGVNLAADLYNFPSLASQGIYGCMYALVVIAGEDYIPAGALNSPRGLINEILTYKNGDGGFTYWPGEPSDIDTTAMALQALAPYYSTPSVKEAVDGAFGYLQSVQIEDGTFPSWGASSSEAISQIIIAISTVGKDASEFMSKNGVGLVDLLKSFALEDGTFAHVKGGESDPYATEQALLALSSHKLYLEGERLYGQKDGAVLPEDFKDIALAGWGIGYIRRAQQYGIFGGVGDNYVQPVREMTGGEFIRAMVSLKGGNPGNSPDGEWYLTWVEYAEKAGWLEGLTDSFDPDAPVSRQDAAVIIAGAFDLTASVNPVISDEDDVSGYALDSVKAVMVNGVMIGVGDDVFDPSGTMNRSMGATVCVRLYEKYIME